MRQCESMSSEGTKTSFWHFLYENGHIFVFCLQVLGLKLLCMIWLFLGLGKKIEI